MQLKKQTKKDSWKVALFFLKIHMNSGNDNRDMIINLLHSHVKALGWDWIGQHSSNYFDTY